MKTTPNIKNQEIKKIEPNQGSDNLRQDWIECTFADVIEIISGKNQKKVVNPNGKYPIYGSGGIIGKANEYLCEAGTTIIGRKGTINSPIYVTEKFWNVDTAFGFHPYSILNNKLLYYFCLHFNFKKLDKSTTIPSLAKRDLLQIPFVLPPILIQKAIVKKIEELFSSLDSGIADLKKAQDQLVIYRQAVLKKAFEGELTNTKISNGDLPINWNWASIFDFLFDNKKGMATGPFGTALKKHEHKQEGVPVLGIENIGEGKFKMPNKIFVTPEKSIELKSFKVLENDIIISRSGTVGEICSIPKQMENSLISTNLIRVRLDLEKVLPKFFVYLFQGGNVREQVKELCKGSTRVFLNQTILKKLKLPLCSIEEQKEVIKEIESRLSVCDKVEKDIADSLEKAQALRQSILKKAFEGTLLSAAEIKECKEHKEYEPASVLLERIREEKKKK